MAVQHIKVSTPRVEAGKVEYRRGVIAMTQNQKIPMGTIMARNTAGTKYIVALAATPAGPRFILHYDLEAQAAADYPISVISSGDVRKKQLKFNNAADDSGITNAIIDQLQDYAINAIEDERDFSHFDN